jgi:hypothetical protein
MVIKDVLNIQLRYHGSRKNFYHLDLTLSHQQCLIDVLKCDHNTLVIGYSIGAVAAMR